MDAAERLSGRMPNGDGGGGASPANPAERASRWWRVAAAAVGLVVGSLAGIGAAGPVPGWAGAAVYLAVGTVAGVLAYGGVERLSLRGCR